MNRNDEEDLRLHQEVIRTPLTFVKNSTLIKSDVNILIYLHFFFTVIEYPGKYLSLVQSSRIHTFHHDVRELVAAEVEAGEYTTCTPRKQREMNTTTQLISSISQTQDISPENRCIHNEYGS